MGSRGEAEADPGWSELVEFLSVAGLREAILDRALTVLASADVSNVGLLRMCFADLAPHLKMGTRKVIGDALAATPSVGGSQQPRVEQPAAALPPVAFNVSVSFKNQEVTVRFALPGEDYSSKPIKALLPQLNVLSTQHISGEYQIIGLSANGARLDATKPLRAQGVPPGGALTAVVEQMNAVFARAAGKAKAPPPMPAPAPPPEPHAPPASAQPPQQGDATTHKGAKRGPKADQPIVNKREKPSLWTLGSGGDLGPRMDKMAEKVAKDGGVPVADGEGRAIWCEPCGKRRALGRPFELQNWRSHCGEPGHVAAVALRASLQPAPVSAPEPAPEPESAPQPAPEAEVVYGSAPWLAARMAQWREMRPSPNVGSRWQSD